MFVQKAGNNATAMKYLHSFLKKTDDSRNSIIRGCKSIVVRTFLLLRFFCD